MSTYPPELVSLFLRQANDYVRLNGRRAAGVKVRSTAMAALCGMFSRGIDITTGMDVSSQMKSVDSLLEVRNGQHYLAGLPLLEIKHQETPFVFLDNLRKIPVLAEIECFFDSGRWMEWIIVMRFEVDCQRRGVVIRVSDLTGCRSKQIRLKQLMEPLQAWAERAVRSYEPLAIVITDVSFSLGAP